jgi:hypothetical protein
MAARGQASIEWLALVLLVAAALATGAAVVHPAAALRAALGERADPLAAAYGADVAAAVRRNAPGLVYERGRYEVPVDPRSCRAVACATEPATLFVHVARSAGATYIQYWEYFPDSVWNGIAGRHQDDWESYQVRIDADGRVSARASAHHGYTGRRIGADLNLAQVDPGLVPGRLRGGWTSPTGWLRVAKGSHAGYVARGPLGRRVTPAGEVRLVPLETARLPERYAIVPPWRKRVYTDPESPET